MMFVVFIVLCALIALEYCVMCIVAFQNGTPVYAFKLQVWEPATIFIVSCRCRLFVFERYK